MTIDKIADLKDEIDIKEVIGMLHKGELTVEKANSISDMILKDGTATVGYFLEHLKKSKDVFEKDGVYVPNRGLRIGMTVIKVPPGTPVIPNYYFDPAAHNRFVDMMFEIVGKERPKYS